MSKTRKLSSILFCILALAVTIASAKPSDKSRHIVLMIDHDTHGFIYTMNSERVQNFLLPLSRILQAPGPEPEVILLVHKKATFAMVNDTIGIMSKAGYVAPPRIFVFDSYKNTMNELNYTYSAKIPFSLTGDVPPKN
jgi:hypothetical protein